MTVYSKNIVLFYCIHFLPYNTHYPFIHNKDDLLNYSSVIIQHILDHIKFHNYCILRHNDISDAATWRIINFSIITVRGYIFVSNSVSAPSRMYVYKIYNNLNSLRVTNYQRLISTDYNKCHNYGT